MGERLSPDAPSVREDVLKSLLDGGMTQAEVLNALSSYFKGDYDGYEQAARDNYETDDVEIDDMPLFSEGSGGVWVSAWVWVSNLAAGEDGEDDEDVDGSDEADFNAQRQLAERIAAKSAEIGDALMWEYRAAASTSMSQRLDLFKRSAANDFVQDAD